jgi:carbon-monoxide dehydrogenase medium subunit
LLSEAISLVAHPQIRHRGTVGGSIAHADPAAEIPAAVLLLDAIIHAEGKAGTRTIPAREFFRSFLSTALADDEVLTAVEIPVSSTSVGWACEELCRRPGDYPLAGAAAQVEIQDGVIHDPRVVLYAVSSRPIRATAAEAALEGRDPTPSALKEAVNLAVADIIPTANVHASEQYRLRLAKVVARRAIERALAKVGSDATR